jgi:AAA+ superfamily predicted ATPase
VLSTLLNEMDGIEAGVGVIVIGATTRAGALDAVSVAEAGKGIVFPFESDYSAGSLSPWTL